MRLPPDPDVVRFALLRSDGAWPDAALDGLEVLADGSVELRRLPAVVPPAVAAPGPIPPSGLALDDHCGLFVADTTGGRLVRFALDCPDRVVLPTSLRRPTGICWGPAGRLFVVDSQDACIQVFSVRPFGLAHVWRQGLSRPVAIAADDDAGLYVLDEGLGRIARLDLLGRSDASFAGGPAHPTAIAADPDGTLYVGAAGAGVVRLHRDGSSAGTPLATGTTPQALAVAGGLLYVADEQSGKVLVVSLADGAVTGALAGFRGPVTALAATAQGRIFIKTRLDATYLVAEPGGARVSAGKLTAGPLDAGEENVWFRAAVDAEVPAGAAVDVETFAADSAAATPAWAPAPSLDVLLSPHRHLWLRITLRREPGGAPAASPTLTQVRAETPGDDYLRYLPAVYSRDDGITTRLLALAKAELGDLEAAIANLPRRLEPATAPIDDVAWLAEWQAFGVPERLRGSEHGPQLRALLAELAVLYSRRGTPAGLRRLIEINAGARATIVEEFRLRGTWALGTTSGLGFDTQLPATVVDGVVVGQGVVGQSGPQDGSAWGSALFAPSAHRFTVIVPAADAPSDAERRLIDRTVADEKPAHTWHHLCFPGPRLRVGVQARVGVDAIVASLDGHMVLDDRTRLGVDTRVAGDWSAHDEGASR
jgi:phage tail-like protein